MKINILMRKQVKRINKTYFYNLTVLGWLTATALYLNLMVKYFSFLFDLFCKVTFPICPVYLFCQKIFWIFWQRKFFHCWSKYKNIRDPVPIDIFLYRTSNIRETQIWLTSIQRLQTGSLRYLRWRVQSVLVTKANKAFGKENFVPLSSKKK